MTKLIVSEGQLNKHAAENTEPSFQQQFGILTNAIIIDKFPNISNYRVAFQLIDKNDENTRALGVSINRLDKQFIQVPSFFNNGKIKTGDMMYVPSIDMFRPMSDAWLADVKNMTLSDSGEAVKPEQANAGAATPAAIRVKESNDPVVKTASYAATESSPEISILDTALKMGKQAAYKMVERLSDNRAFLNNTLKFYSGDQIVDFVKTASMKFAEAPTKPEYTVITVLDKRAAQLNETQKAELYQDGYLIVKTAADTGTEGSQGPSDKVLKVDTKIEDPGLFCKISQSGKVELIQPDGELKEAYVLIPNNKYSSLVRKDRWAATMGSNQRNWGGQPYDPCMSEAFAVLPGDKSTYYPIPTNAVCAAGSHESLKGAQIGRVLNRGIRQIPYSALLVTPNGEVYRNPLNDRLYSAQGQGKNPTWGSRQGKLLTISSDYIVKPYVTNTFAEFPKGTRIVTSGEYLSDGIYSREVNETAGVNACTTQNITAVIRLFKRKNYKQIKLYTNGNDYVVSDQGSSDSKSMEPKEAALHIIQRYNVQPTTAKQLLKDTLMGATYDTPKANTYLIQKRAAQQDPWDTANVSRTDVANSGPTITNTSMQSNMNDPEALMQSIQTAADQGIKQVFDVEALKLLARSGDISGHINEFIDDYLGSLDKLCRMLFLLYWHADVMEQKYGMLKLKSLEQSIKNSLTSLSELTVFLKMRGFGGVSSDNYVDSTSLVGNQMM